MTKVRTNGSEIVKSESDPRAAYVVTITNNKATYCTCKGFRYRKSCRHLAVAEEQAEKRRNFEVTPEQAKAMLSIANTIRSIIRDDSDKFEHIKKIISTAEGLQGAAEHLKTARAKTSELYRNTEQLERAYSVANKRVTAISNAWRELLADWGTPYVYRGDDYKVPDYTKEKSINLIKSLKVQAKNLEKHTKEFLQIAAELQKLLRTGAKAKQVDKRVVYKMGVSFFDAYDSIAHGRLNGIIRKAQILKSRIREAEQYEDVQPCEFRLLAQLRELRDVLNQLY